jgi:hypothetical protein
MTVALSLQLSLKKEETGMAHPRHIAIGDDDPVKRRGNDERDDRYPYGGERKANPGKRSRTPVQAVPQTSAPAKKSAVVSPRKAGAPSRRSATKVRPPK